jgi:hypothetical protein
VAAAVAVLAVVLSHDSPCGPAPALSANTESMKAIVYRCYGAPEVLSFESIEKPAPADNEILVKVGTAAVNLLDWHYTRGETCFMRLGSGLGAPK